MSEFNPMVCGNGVAGDNPVERILDARCEELAEGRRVAALVRKLRKALDNGIISEQEYAAKVAEIEGK